MKLKIQMNLLQKYVVQYRKNNYSLEYEENTSAESNFDLNRGVWYLHYPINNNQNGL